MEAGNLVVCRHVGPWWDPAAAAVGYLDITLDCTQPPPNGCIAGNRFNPVGKSAREYCMALVIVYDY